MNFFLSRMVRHQRIKKKKKMEWMAGSIPFGFQKLSLVEKSWAFTVIAREDRRREKGTEETQRQRRMMWNEKDWNWGGNSNIWGGKGQTEEDWEMVFLFIEENLYGVRKRIIRQEVLEELGEREMIHLFLDTSNSKFLWPAPGGLSSRPFSGAQKGVLVLKCWIL